MAIDSYANLQAAIIDIDGSDDIRSFLPTAIQLCESEMYANEEEILGLREMEVLTTSTTSTASRFLSLPPRFISMRRVDVEYDGRKYSLEYKTPDCILQREGTGRPCYFTVTNQIEFDILPDASYIVTLQHIADIAPLSDVDTTNIVLTRFPNIYLFGALKFVNQRNAEQELAEYYHGKFIQAIRGANQRDRSGRYGPGPRMRMKVAVN